MATGNKSVITTTTVCAAKAVPEKGYVVGVGFPRYYSKRKSEYGSSHSNQRYIIQ